MGVLTCPFVFSTNTTASTKTVYQYGYDPVNPSFPYYNDATGEIILATDVKPQGAFVTPPLSYLQFINGSEYWVTRPLMCWMIEWYRNPIATIPDGYFRLRTPSGQGTISIYVNVRSVNQNSSSPLLVTYMPAIALTITPATGPTNGVNVTFALMNGPPAFNLSTLWAPFLLSSYSTATSGAEPVESPVDLTKAPMNRIMFSLGGTAVDLNPQECVILDPALWMPVTVTCLAPPGLGIFTYDKAVIFTTEALRSVGPTLGFDLITLRGRSLGASPSIFPRLFPNASIAVNSYRGGINSNGNNPIGSNFLLSLSMTSEEFPPGSARKGFVAQCSETRIRPSASKSE